MEFIQNISTLRNLNEQLKYQLSRLMVDMRRFKIYLYE